MDKENLYYIVEKDSNMRKSGMKEELYIASMEKARKDASTHSQKTGYEHEAISIKDYEEKYEPKRHPKIDVCPVSPCMKCCYLDTGECNGNGIVRYKE